MYQATPKTMFLTLNNIKDKWAFIFRCVIREPTEVKINFRLLLVYATITIIYSYLYRIELMGQFLLLTIGGLTFLFYYYMIADIYYFSTYYDTKYYVGKLVSNGINISNLEDFQISYNKLRINIKRRVERLNKNLLSHDYKINHINQSIDIFFDTTINILFKRGVMSFQYTPYDEFQYFLEKTFPEYPDYEPEDTHEDEIEILHNEKNIKQIDFNAIEEFLISFERNIINSPKPRSMNLYVLEQLFERWNTILATLENELFEITNKKVVEYYISSNGLTEKRKEQRGRILESILTNVIALLITILIALLIYFITKN